MKIQPLKGTRDWYPEDKVIQDYIFQVWEKVSKKFGYQNVDGPMLEPADLWRLKSGNEIPDQMYVFKDKGNREVAIRPELTPTIARMIAEKQSSLTMPIKWYSIGRFWRYERAQAGRLREFFQLNVDCIGSDSIQLDAEVIAVSIEIMKSFGLTEKDFVVRVGNRKLIQSLILGTGVKQNQLTDVSRLIDKLDKIGKDNFVKLLNDLKLTKKVVNNLLNVLNLDLKKVKVFDKDGKQGLKELKDLMKYLQFYQLDKYVKYDSTIMRGLDYYTSTVFEISDVEKKFRAIAGGGRYENLIADFGGQPLAGVGFAYGDVVLQLFLESKNKLFKFDKNIDYFIAVIDEKSLELSISIANELRKKYNVEIELLQRNVTKQLKYADKINAKNVIVIGPDEVKSKKYKVKNLKTGKEKSISL